MLTTHFTVAVRSFETGARGAWAASCGERAASASRRSDSKEPAPSGIRGGGMGSKAPGAYAAQRPAPHLARLPRNESSPAPRRHRHVARARAALGLLVLLAHPSPASAQDTTPPTLERAFVTVSGRHIVLNFFEDLQLRSKRPPASAFTVTADGSAVTVSGSLRDSIHPMALWISVSPAVRQGQTVVVTYTDPTSGDDANAIQDTAGNDAASFTTGSGGVPVVINESSVGSPTAPVQDTGPPTLDKARVFSTGLKIMFRFSGGLQESNLPPASAFTVTADGSDVPVSGFYRLPFVLTHLEMGFSLGVRRGQTVVVSYTDPTSGDDANAIQDTAGNDAASFTTGSGGVPAVINESRLSPTVITPPPPTRPPPTDGGGGGTRGPSQTVPGAPRNLLADATDGAVTLTWDAPENDDGSEITDYEYRIDRRNPWISIGSTQTTHTVTGLDNGTAYVFEVRAVNRIGKSFSSNRAEATPEAPEVFTLDFAHFANGNGTTSDLVFVNVAPQPVRPALYFYDTEGNPIAAESVVDITGDLEIREDGGLTVLTEMEPLGELTIATHGQGDLVSGSVKVASEGLIGGMLRFDLPGIGEAVVGASPPVRDALFPVRRQEGGITTGVAIHNLGAEAVEVSCLLMSGGVVLEEVEIPLEANGQTAWLIDAAFPAADTSNFAGSVRCAAPGRRRFSAVALEMDPGTRVFITLPLFPVDRGGGGPEAALDFAHFANGDGTTSDLVFVNVSTQRSRPAPTPFHTDILPSRPAIYFYDTEGNPIAAESVVDITGDLAIQEDGGLTVQTQMEPLGVLTVSTHGQGALVSGSVKVVSDGPIGGMLRYYLPHVGVAVVEASPPISDAIFPVRRREGGITTGVAIHNLESSPGLVHCDLMREGVLLDAVSIPLEANGQTSWLIDQAFPATDTSDFAGSVRCDAVGEGRFSAVALEMDPATRIFTALPVVPFAERMSQE